MASQMGSIIRELVLDLHPDGRDIHLHVMGVPIAPDQPQQEGGDEGTCSRFANWVQICNMMKIKPNVRFFIQAPCDPHVYQARLALGGPTRIARSATAKYVDVPGRP